MQNEELIQSLRSDAEWAHGNEWETPITLGDHLDAAIDALEAADKAQRWIPASERLPDGVGSYLNVHEGPHQVRMEYMPAPLRAGMTLTDEPGLYLAGKFGVRIENTVLIQDYKETEFGKFLQIESLTLCPIDTTPIDVEMLLPEEIAWLNDYHAEVYARLAPYLDEEEKKWLKNATKAIK